MNTLIATCEIPDDLLVAKLGFILTGSAERWYQERVREFPRPSTWPEWHAAIEERFESEAWHRTRLDNFQRMTYSGAESPMNWLERFTQTMRSAHPGCSDKDIQDTVLLRCPPQIAFGLRTTLSGSRPSMTAFGKAFEDVASVFAPSSLASRSLAARNFSARNGAALPASSRSAEPATRAVGLQAQQLRPAALPASRPPGEPDRPSAAAGRLCYKCRTPGHIARDCTNPPAVQALDTFAAEGDEQIEQLSSRAGSDAGSEVALSDLAEEYAIQNLDLASAEVFDWSEEEDELTWIPHFGESPVVQVLTVGDGSPALPAVQSVTCNDDVQTEVLLAEAGMPVELSGSAALEGRFFTIGKHLQKFLILGPAGSLARSS
ncbi:hypothetical protein BCR35DRAFT_336602 [Leucosporidium creatinivorum]|uniref:CCHC-type domain-containing protein n=1 Tax=Leucosporidium creatinivorum TaxID=106004 RepID=A0A1Y2BTP9_9BASI|nr:hypothetical protein BCR35DRAFT_336602 [Leucosporidium creatinivorum]